MGLAGNNTLVCTTACTGVGKELIKCTCWSTWMYNSIYRCGGTADHVYLLECQVTRTALGCTTAYTGVGEQLIMCICWSVR